MTNNLELIKPLLEFPHKDTFYFVQILQRKKDHKGIRIGGSNNNSRVIKTYYIRSVDHLEIHWEEIVKLCEVFGARASISLNPRNFIKAAYHHLQKLANQMSNGEFHHAYKAYDSVCGEYHSEIDKRWIIDIDYEDMSNLPFISAYIEELQKEITNVQYKILAFIPSKSGCHIISQPFNKAKFKEKFPIIEIHCNNPTNLYIP